MFRSLKLEFRGAVATVTLNRPEARNAMSAKLMREMIACAEKVAARRDVAGNTREKANSSPARPSSLAHQRANAAGYPIEAVVAVRSGVAHGDDRETTHRHR